MSRPESEQKKPVKTELHVLDYRGRTITSYHVSEELTAFSRRGSHFYADVDGRRSSRLLISDTEDLGPVLGSACRELVKKAKQIVDGWIADEELRPYLEKSIAHYGLAPQGDRITVLKYGWRFDHQRQPADFKVLEPVVVHSRGCYRDAVVEKTGRTKVTVAYVTSHGGQVTRRTVAPAELGIGGR